MITAALSFRLPDGSRETLRSGEVSVRTAESAGTTARIAPPLMRFCCPCRQLSSFTNKRAASNRALPPAWAAALRRPESLPSAEITPGGTEALTLPGADSRSG